MDFSKQEELENRFFQIYYRFSDLLHPAITPRELPEYRYPYRQYSF
jgi:hypothetical protein